MITPAISVLAATTVGRAFGPIMVLWFSTLGLLGLVQIVQHPEVLRAVNPVYGALFFLDNG